MLELNIPTAVPLVYELDDNLKPIKKYYLLDEAEVQVRIQPTRQPPLTCLYSASPPSYRSVHPIHELHLMAVHLSFSSCVSETHRCRGEPGQSQVNAN